jgi:hypothetical protein
MAQELCDGQSVKGKIPKGEGGKGQIHQSLNLMEAKCRKALGKQPRLFS